VVGYNVYRGDTSGGGYSRINSPLEASTSYSDAGVSGGATYYYVITAVDGNGIESGYSTEARAVIPAP
jgi:fibronectin type 3 domain-containing protein